MGKVLDLKELNDKIQEEIKQELKTCMIRPSIAIIKIGDNELANFSIKQKEKVCNKMGIYFRLFEFDENTPELAIINKIKELNNDEYVNGIMVELPIPTNYNERRILNTINNAKDIDGLTDINMGRFMNGRKALTSSVTLAISKLFETTGTNLYDKDVLIFGCLKHINRSLISFFLNNGSNVMVCQEDTLSLNSKIALADVIVIGSHFPEECDIQGLKDDTILIDLGILDLDDDHIISSIDKNILKKYTYTEIPNGINKLAITMLLNNVMMCYKNTK